MKTGGKLITADSAAILRFILILTMLTRFQQVTNGCPDHPDSLEVYFY